MDKVLIISGHDYRSRRRADTHFIADELSKEASVRFFSLGFSNLSRFRADPRADLISQANRVVRERSVDCYLWKTLVHPFRMRAALLQPVERMHFALYRSRPPSILKKWIAESSYIVFDSGMPPIFIALAHAINSDAILIYNAADNLSTIGCSSYISTCLADSMAHVDWIRVPSRALQTLLPPGGRMFYIPHGMDPTIGEDALASPYGPGLHAVSVGSMLFDASFFRIAAAAFPEVSFHVIGPGAAGQGLCGPNIRVYDEMPFQGTLPFVKHAAFGVAPYRNDGIPAYLADTSMKLRQYSFFGIPAVCPSFATGGDPRRFGYGPGDNASIVAAIASALEAGQAPPGAFLSWREVAERLLRPTEFADTVV